MTLQQPTQDDLESRELIAQAAHGSERAMRRLYALYRDEVYSIARRLAGDNTLAEDWAQDAWLRVFRGLRDFRGDSRVSTWIHRIAVNAALNGRRRHARSAGREVGLEETLSVMPAGSVAASSIDVMALVDRLPEGMRRVLVLYDVEGYSHDEIAAQLGTTSSNSRSQLVRARTKLRAWAFGERGVE